MPQPHLSLTLSKLWKAIALFSTLGWETINAYQETLVTNGTLGRETRSEVVLLPRLRSALQQLNPDLPHEALQLAIEELTRDRSTSLEATNREIYQLLKHGVKVRFKADDVDILPPPTFGVAGDS